MTLPDLAPSRVDLVTVIAVTVAVLALLVWALLPIGASSVPAPTVASLVRHTERRPVASNLIQTFAVLRRPEPSTAPAMPRGVAVSMLSRGAFLLNLARARGSLRSAGRASGSFLGAAECASWHRRMRRCHGVRWRAGRPAPMGAWPRPRRAARRHWCTDWRQTEAARFRSCWPLDRTCARRCTATSTLRPCAPQATVSSSGRRLVGLFKPDRPSWPGRSVAVVAGTCRSFRGCPTASC
jgi:hypothetical protein